VSGQNSVDFWLRLAAQAWEDAQRYIEQAKQFEQFAADARRELERKAES
jgi:hypothetical protein